MFSRGSAVTLGHDEPIAVSPVGKVQQPGVTVVSLAHNRRANVAELLASLRCQTMRPAEIILIDNASTDGTVDMVRRDFPEVRLIETGANLGMVAYNLGFEAAQGDYILVMDDDGLPGSADWIEQVVARFEANPRLGAVSCTVRMRDTGRIAHDSPQFVPEGSAAEGYPGVAFNGTGAGLRREALRQTRLYPWRFFRTYLELHLCTQLLDRGWQVRHFPELEVWHSRRPPSTRERPYTYYGLRNYYWYTWELYPWPQVLGETLHELGSRTKLVLLGQIPVGRFWRATRDAFLSVRTILSQRRPVSLETLRRMRRVRRCGNWHGLAPEVRLFDRLPQAEKTEALSDGTESSAATHRRVSMLSVAYNRRRNVHELLTAVHRQTHPPLEVILVDNGSTDGTADMVRSEFPEVKLIETGANLGMVAYNLGFEAAQGEYILVMDDDGLPGSDDWIAQVAACFEANPRLGAACCTVRMRDTGLVAHDSPQFVPEGSAAEGYPGVAFNGTGAGLRAAVLRQVGFYPWYFTIMYLELHLCTRLLDAGWQVRHFPQLEVWHSRPSGSSDPPFSYRGLRNYYWYVWQFYPWPEVLTETLHELGSRLKLVARGAIPFARFGRATRDAFLGAGKALAQRRPVSRDTLHYLRLVRRHGHEEGPVDRHRPFAGM